MKQCNICNRKYKGITCVIFVPNEERRAFGLPMGKNLFVCTECNMSYLAQYFDMTNREISDWLKWVDK